MKTPRRLFFIPVLAGLWGASCTGDTPTASMRQWERDARFAVCAASIFVALLVVLSLIWESVED